MAEAGQETLERSEYCKMFAKRQSNRIMLNNRLKIYSHKEWAVSAESLEAALNGWFSLVDYDGDVHWWLTLVQPSRVFLQNSRPSTGRRQTYTPGWETGDTARARGLPVNSARATEAHQRHGQSGRASRRLGRGRRG